VSGCIDLRIDDEGIADFHMADREGKNIFSDRFIDDFLVTLEEADRAEPKVMVLRGLPDVFCGGAEKQTLLDLSDGKVVVKDLILSERLVSTRFPVIAAMEGHAMGGGLVLGLCCDMVVAARESRYGAVFMSMGFTPGMGCTTLLPELVGPFVAAEMMYTAKRFRGKELEAKGTNINYIVPKAQVAAKAQDLALQIAEKSLRSLYLLKYSLSAPKKKLLVDARLQEDMMHEISFKRPETRERILELYADYERRHGSGGDG
jgi:polyketide biosynthesis enoyl-CoA hydratase PksI